MLEHCVNVTADFLDDPISEVVISQISLPGLAERVLEKLADEYQHAKEQTASFKREMKRLVH